MKTLFGKVNSNYSFFKKTAISKEYKEKKGSRMFVGAKFN
jgi:hypothetical protein